MLLADRGRGARLGPLTLGTFSLSVCDEAASVVTARFERRGIGLLLRGRAEDSLSALLKIIATVKCELG